MSALVLLSARCAACRSGFVRTAAAISRPCPFCGHPVVRHRAIPASHQHQLATAGATTTRSTT